MTYRRILAAVDDSPAGLGAARAAIELAGVLGATVRALTVLSDHVLAGRLSTRSVDPEARMAAGGRSVLAWTAQLARRADVPCETVERDGEPFRGILDEADRWDADLIVMGRSDRRGPSSPYLGSETAHVLEFTDLPVLVIPTEVPVRDG
jgi:nucleotide-binding universal stress UspA family protein